MARVTNALLVRWSQGWLEVEDATSIATHGRHEEFLSAGNADSEAEAERLALSLLARMAWADERLTIAIEPSGVSDVPYDHFETGDNVTAPDAAGTARQWRVRGITVTEDDEGYARFIPELSTDESGS